MHGVISFHIDRPVWDQLRPIDYDFRADTMCFGSEVIQVVDMAGYVGCAGNGNVFNPVSQKFQLVFEIIGDDTPLGIDGYMLYLADSPPREFIGMVLHHGGEDDIAFLNGETMRKFVNGFGRVFGKYDYLFFKVGVNKLSYQIPGLLKGPTGQL
jgi:hypothetical protein